jgi:2-oxoglutarate dehydrogenase E2 component (dihydrolipoamide succinyltransferase)
MSNIVVPQLGESVVEARVARWLKKEGDPVAVGEPVVELETEKIDLEVGAEHGGVLASIKRQEGEDVKVGELLAVVDDGARGRPAAAPQSPHLNPRAPPRNPHPGRRSADPRSRSPTRGRPLPPNELPGITT